MRGGIQKKGNRYYAVIYDGIDPGTGKKRRTWVPAGTRRKDAETVLNAEIRRRLDGEPVPTEKLTLSQYLTEGRKKPTGKKPNAKVSKAKAPAADGEGEEGKPVGLAPKTVRNIHLMLNKAMADAQRKGIVIRNVVSLADAPSLKNRQEGNIKVWDVDQLRTFLDAVRDHRLHPAFHLSSHTGMRRGEVLGLRWCDLDLDAKRLSVRQTLVSIAYDVEISDVKTGTGRRTIPTPRSVEGWRAREDLGGEAGCGDPPHGITNRRTSRSARGPLSPVGHIS